MFQMNEILQTKQDHETTTVVQKWDDYGVQRLYVYEGLYGDKSLTVEQIEIVAKEFERRYFRV